MIRVQYAIAFVTDLLRSTAFDRDVVGRTPRFESPVWTEFASDGATLALRPSPGAGKPPVAAGAEPPRGFCRFGLGVPDLDDFHARMLARGIPCPQPPEDVLGARLARYADPDGLIFSVGEARPA